MAGSVLRYSKELHRAADAIRKATALVFASGAGMGRDSGLPDFRGPEGFWNAYPPLKKLGIELAGMSNPRWFENDPEFAWGFFGHRYNMYQNSEPNHGFQILKDWGESKELGYFVFTSNVDGHFQKAGFPHDRIVECHGSINYLQCIDPEHSQQLWQFPEGYRFDVDETTLKSRSELPQGPPGKETCLARPNILMFGDWYWISDRTDAQGSRFYDFQKDLQRNVDANIVVIEIGAGLSVPTVRMTTEGIIGPRRKGTLIRINPNESHVPTGNIALPMGGLAALTEINNLLAKGY